MTAAPHLDLVTVEEYFSAEEASEVKHEYVGGVVYAMSGGTFGHSAIATNALASLGGQLRGKRCRVLNSDMKVRIQFPTHTRFYYPDVSVVCSKPSEESTYYDEPTVVIEVLSPSTRRTDEGEKKDAYLTIPSLAVYMLVEPEAPAVVVYRRGDQGFGREVFQDPNAVIPLPEIEAELRLSELYDSIGETE